MYLNVNSGGSIFLVEPALGAKGAAALATWIHRGGGYVGICAGVSVRHAFIIHYHKILICKHACLPHMVRNANTQYRDINA